MLFFLTCLIIAHNLVLTTLYSQHFCSGELLTDYFIIRYRYPWPSFAKMRITRSMSTAGLIDGAGDTHMTDDVALPSTKRTVPRKNKVQLNEDIIALIAEHCDYTTV